MEAGIFSLFLSRYVNKNITIWWSWSKMTLIRWFVVVVLVNVFVEVAELKSCKKLVCHGIGPYKAFGF